MFSEALVQAFQAFSKRKKPLFAIVNRLPNTKKHCRVVTYIAGTAGGGVFICGIAVISTVAGREQMEGAETRVN